MNKKIPENYVCPQCFEQIQNCICKHLPWKLIMVDVHIQPIVKMLNRKGYITTSCCEGHYDGKYGTTIHISFMDNIDYSSLPEGFKYIKNRRLVEYYISPKHNKEQVENIKKQKIEELLEWADSLPNLRN